MKYLITYLCLWALTCSSAIADLTFEFNGPSDSAVTASSYSAFGVLDLSLSYQPTPGRSLTVVKNTGPAFISGTFDGVPQGATVALTFSGITYNYVADYFGGNGRSFILRWPLTGLAAWGSNQYWQLGNGGTSDQTAPVAVDQRGSMAGSPISHIDAGQNHTLALSTDNRIFAWGDNYGGQLGNAGIQRSKVPVAVDLSGVLAGRTVVAVSGGGNYSLALDSSGLAYAWGDNTFGNLGNGNSSASPVPVAVDASGVLNGKTLTAIAAGNRHALALSSEGMVYAWGTNSPGALGNNYANGTFAGSSVPVAVDTSGVLAGKTIVAIDAGYYTSLALSSDGEVFSWGYNARQGNGSITGSPVPVALSTSGAMAGKTIVAIALSDYSYNGLALDSDGKIYTWGFDIASANGTVGSSAPVEVNTGSILNGKTVVSISGRSSRCTVTTSDGEVFVWEQDATSGGLVPVVATGDLAGRFVSAITEGASHRVELMAAGPPMILRQPWSRTLAQGQTATFTAKPGNEFPSSVQWQVSPTGPDGEFSDIAGNPSATTDTLSLENVTPSQHGHAFRAVFSNVSGSRASRTATLDVVGWTATYASADDVPFTSESITVSGNLDLQLGFAPAPGTDLTVIRNTGTEFISGTFANVPQGGTVALTHNSITYNFIADYFGGNGRSLVLHWARTRLMTWGENEFGKLGTGDSTEHLVPAEVETPAAMLGNVTKLRASGDLSMALTADGRLFTWGSSSNGRLGTDTSTPYEPTEVTAAGALAGKTVVDIAASGHCLALTSEGRVYAWGLNRDRQLGIGSSDYTFSYPVELAPEAFGGQQVVSISAGTNHSMALTSDGRVFSWGSNSSGKTGNGWTTSSTPTPTEIITSENLNGVTIVAIAAGSAHSLALASDGRVFAWGDTDFTGTGSTGFNDLSPTPVFATGALAGKTITRIAASEHSLVLTTDGDLIGWGSNYKGQLGTGSTIGSPLPVAITGGALAGKVVSSITCYGYNSAVTTTDGGAFTWGGNSDGQLGDGTTMDRSSPVAVASLGGPSGLKAISMAAGESRTLALVDAGPPRIVSQPSHRTASENTKVTFTALATDPFGYETKWQVSTAGPAGPFTDVTGNASAATSTLVIDAVTSEQDQWAWRAVFSNVSGSSATEPAVLDLVTWSGLLVSPTDIPNQAEGPVVGGTLDLNLGFAPAPGTSLTVLENTGLATIDGTFSNIPQGGRITLNHGGATYEFIANYFGGNGRSLVLQWPWMKIAAAGSNSSFQLGQSGLASSSTPLTLPSGTWSSGRSILAVSAGANHNLAVMSDGRIAAWGRNSSGQLGNGTSTSSAIPVDVVSTGALGGETVVAVAAGDSHSLALTQSGRVFAWGLNSSGQLGDGSTTLRTEPVEVSGLGSQIIVAIAAGDSHNLALTNQGMIYAWGAGSSGQLGNKSDTQSPLAVPVHVAGVLAGKRTVAIAAGSKHSLALTSEGQVLAWGANSFGALGINDWRDSNAPVAVHLASGLAGEFVVEIAAGTNFSLARTEEDKLFAWGINSNRQFGNNTPSSSQVPVEVPPDGARIGKTILKLSTGSSHSLAVTTDGQLLAWGSNSSGQLGAGNTASQQVPVAATISAVQSSSCGASHTIALIAGASAPEITAHPASKSVLQADGDSVSIQFSAAALDVFPLAVQWQESENGPAGPFSNIVGNASAVTTTLALADVSPSLNGHAYRAVFSNSVSSSIGTPATLSVATAPSPVHFGSPTEIPMNAESPILAGSLNVTLGFAPIPGADLTVVHNTGSGFLSGGFSNLAQGEEIQLGFDGRNHKFIVDYFGGNGRSLVLHWAETLTAGWGLGSSGQLGAGSNRSTNRTSVAVVDTGALAGHKVVKLAAGTNHSLALSATGSVFAWGSNGSGRLGDGSTTSSNVPIEVDTTGELAGKKVVAIAAGEAHSLALTADGQITAWGSNSYYMLGNGGIVSSTTPVAVSRDGVLAGRIVTAIAAGQYHSIALTADGSLVAWGRNTSGQLGSGSTALIPVPIAVANSGALAGKTVIAIAAGANHSLALTSDGRVYGWGSNQYGQLGNGSGSSTFSSPTAISGGGLIDGKTVVAIAAGASHSLAVTSDGMVYAWGLGSQGQLGTGNNSTSYNPVAVSTSGVLAGKAVVAISAGGSHSLAISSDGLGFAWGMNREGQLGNNSFSDSNSPVAMSPVGAIGSRPLVAIAAGGTHSLAFAGKGTAPTVTQSPTSLSVTAGSTVSFAAAADGYPAPTLRWQRSTTGTTGSFTDITGQTSPTLSLTNVTASQNDYAYRAVFTNLESSSNSSAATLTVQPTLASFLLSQGLAANAPPLDDPFHTGVPHLLAYAFDLNPTAPDRTKLPAASRVAGRLRISYTRWKNATDLRYIVEADDGLDGWQSGPGITETVSVTPLDNSREAVIEQEILPDPTPSRFLRIRVELDPP